MGTIREIWKDECPAPAGFMENLGALCMWAMVESDRRLEVKEMVGRAPNNRAMVITLYEVNKKYRSVTLELCSDLTDEDAQRILDVLQ